MFLTIPLSSNIHSYCYFDTIDSEAVFIDEETLQKGIIWGLKRNLLPMYVFPESDIPDNIFKIVEDYKNIKIVPVNHHNEHTLERANIILAQSCAEILGSSHLSREKIYILRTTLEDIEFHLEGISELLENVKKLNIILTTQITDTLFQRYEIVLSVLSDNICKIYAKHIKVHLNILTDRLYCLKMNNCNSGVRSFALSVNGDIFPCLGYYYSKFSPITNTEVDFDYTELFRLDKAPVCRLCDCWHCFRCVWDNYRTTGERNIPSHEQCVKSHLERKYSKQILDNLNALGITFPVSTIEAIDYFDPLEYFFKY